MSEELPVPDDSMSAEEKGELLLMYLQHDRPAQSFRWTQAALTSANLSGAKLTGTNLGHLHAPLSVWDEAELRGADLVGSQLSETSFWEADLTDAGLLGVQLIDAELSGSKLTGALLAEANISGACIEGAVLDNADVSKATFARLRGRGSSLVAANFEEARGELADLRGALLHQANLVRCTLNRARLDDADLSEAHLEHADLRNAVLDGADLSGASLMHADLRGASLINACLEGADLCGVDLHGAILGGYRGTPRRLDGCRIDERVFHLSIWSLDHLRAWTDNGALYPESQLPPGFRVSANQGLTLYFNTRLHRLDRILIEGIIVIVLGRSTDVDVAEYRREEENTIVRLTGSDPADLEAVANALWHRVWEQGFQQRTQLIENRGDVGTQVNVAGDYLAPRELPELVARLEALQKVGGDLSALRDVLERIELRLGQGEAEVRREWTEGK